MLFRILLLISFALLALDEVCGQQAPGSKSDNSGYSSAGSGVTSSVGFSGEPQLVSGGNIDVPPRWLKKGVEGSVSVRVDIRQDGTVERCALLKSSNPLLDSLVLANVPRFVYSPAVEKGQAVASTVDLEILFNPDSILAKSKDAPPEIEGTVLDRDTRMPLTDAVLHMQFADSTSDPDISIGFNRYVKMIGAVPGQTTRRSILSTAADSTGHFAFRLLPDCPATVSVQARGREIAHFTEHPRSGHRIFVKYFLGRIAQEPSSSDSSNTITVYGRQAGTEVVSVERQEVETGLTHYVSKLLIQQSAIRQVPEAGSALLVRSAGPFDNRYLLAGVPFLAPFHFGGSPYADIDGMMVSTLSDITITVDRIAGRYTDACGALIEANPGIYRPADPKLIRRPEMSIDFSMMSVDFLLSVPVGMHTNDYLQIGFSCADNYDIKMLYDLYGMSGEADLDLGQPYSFYNVTATATNTVNSLQFDSYAWLALDEYDQETVPWGMASVRMHPVGQDNLSVLCGGSRQYFAKGKRVGNNDFLRTAYLNNGEIQGTIDSVISGVVDMNLDCRIDYQDWHGSVIQRDTTGIDTGVSAKGDEAGCHVHGCFTKELGPIKGMADLLCSGILYGKTPDVLFDAGFSLFWNIQDFQTELHFGRVTSRPDIRGLPDSAFRQQHLESYLVSLPVSYRGEFLTKLGIQPYFRFQDRCPQMDPMLNIWDTAGTTALFAEGVDIDGELQPFSWAAIHGALNLASAQRSKDNHDSLYEWEIPWTIRGGLHCSFLRNLVHLYLDYTLTKGLPYYDFNEKAYLELPDYGRLDVSVQYRSPIQPNRFITRYDAYFNVYNALDTYNVRDYFWNRQMQRMPIWLSPVNCDMGLRLGLRL